MEDLHNRFIFTQWKHNNGYEQKWMRRITRQTNTQYIADCQHTLDCSAKYENSKIFVYKVFQHCAHRFNLVDNSIVERYYHNPDGIANATLIDDFEILKCKYDYDELFGIDIRKVLTKDSITVKNAEEYYVDIYKDTWIKSEEEFYTVTPILCSSNTDIYAEVVSHLENLFKRPIYRLKNTKFNINTIHDSGKYSSTAIHYHMNHFGGDKKLRTFSENQHNTTISFWLFDDKVVFKTEDGIDSW